MATSSKVPGRVIMRIELFPQAKACLEAHCDRTGMTQVATSSRIIDWFCGQSDVVQAAVLGVYPNDIREQIPTIILKRMVSNKKAPP